jgi:ABC-type glycerol-3-phosphate transport system substrate-binding protein
MALTTVINMKEELDDIIKLKLSRREALSKTAKIAIGAIIAAAIAGGGGYYAYTSLYKPKATVRVVAIAHAAPGMKAVAEEDFMKKYPNIEIETLLFDWETGRDRQIHDFSTRAGEY